MKHYPIATINNNRYRGPIETIKINNFYEDVESNINHLKKIYDDLEDRTLYIDNIIKTRKYYTVTDNINNIIDFINNCNPTDKTTSTPGNVSIAGKAVVGINVVG